MRALLVIIGVAVASFHYTDLESDSAFHSVLLPLVFVASLIALAVWLVMRMNPTGGSGGGGGGYFGGGGGSGDCGGGGGDGGC